MNVVTDRARDASRYAGDAALVVMCAANNYDSVKVADHHLAEVLAPRVPLLYVDPPLSPLSPRRNPLLAASIEAPHLRLTEAGFWRLTPVVAPMPMRAGVRRFTEILVRRALKRAVASLGRDVSAVVTAWPELDVFGCCAEQLRVWWAQDDFAAGAVLMGRVTERVASRERLRAAGSDVVVAANPAIARRWVDAGLDVELIPYGSDPASFAMVDGTMRAADVDLEPPVAVLVGQLNERVDPALLHAVAEREVSLLLVGPAGEGARAWLSELTARPNVAWVGPQPFTALPGYLAHAQVGLVPYADTAFNRGSFPLKTLEYLSAGLPVVATDLPATRWLDADPALVAIAQSANGFADAVAASVRQPMTANAREQRRSFARVHSYERRADDLLAAIEARLPTRQP